MAALITQKEWAKISRKWPFGRIFPIREDNQTASLRIIIQSTKSCNYDYSGFNAAIKKPSMPEGQQVLVNNQQQK